MENKIKLIPPHRRYRLLADGSIFDRIKNTWVGHIPNRSDQDMCYELRGRAQQEFMKKFISDNEK